MINSDNALLFMLVWHALADYPLQGDFLAKAKNRSAPIPGVPWYQAMVAHSLIHAGGAAFITGSWILGGLEFVFHFLIDHAKCSGKIGFNYDQTLHFVCKCMWAVVLMFGLLP